jgi:acetate---CoA ligase (ADP-forming)
MNLIMTDNLKETSDLTEFWRALFQAESIAVIGANNQMGSWGYDALHTALNSKTTKPDRQVYAINPSDKMIQGIPAYPTILDIPGPVELAIIVVRASLVPTVARQCAAKQIKAGVIISAGFAEADNAGADLQAEVRQIAHAAGFHFVGPNCVGHGDGYTRVASAGMVNRIGAGPMALITQSGTLGATIIQMAASRGIGMSKFISTGNEADLKFEDYLEFLKQDGNTGLIAGYIEGLREGRRFFELAKTITPSKPVIVIKTGTTAGSSQAAKSHTGALAGADNVYSAAFRQSGIIRVDDEDELCDVISGLLNSPLPKGNRVGILTMGGGFGVVTSEACEKEGLKMGVLSPQTIDQINQILPPRWSHGNPVDMVGVRTMGGDPAADKCLELLMADPNIDIVISLLPPVILPSEMAGNLSPAQIRSLYDAVIKQREFLQRQVVATGKPLILLRFFSQPVSLWPNLPPLPAFNIPEYTNPRRAARVLYHLEKYSRYLSKPKEQSPVTNWLESTPVTTQISARLLSEVESKEKLQSAGIPVNPTFLARNQRDCLRISRDIGYPVVMKIMSPDIAHKSDAGGVITGLANAAQVEKAYHTMLTGVKNKLPQARIEGVSIQKMARPGVEIIIGMNRDSQFGPVIMFGLGGTLVEIFKDVSFRLVPVTPEDAAEMVHEIKGLALLQGYRGREPVNLELLEKMIMDLSLFIVNNPQIQELDLNPVFGYQDGLVAVDARIVTD